MLYSILLVFTFIGFILAFIGGVMFIIAAFRESALWGVGVLFNIPFVNLFFLIKYWDEAKKAFGIQVLGFLLFFAGIGAAMSTGMESVAKGFESMNLPVPEAVEDARGVDIEKLARKAAPVSAFGGKVDESYVGRTIREVRDELGAPQATLEADGRTIYYYPGAELISTNGETISEQGVPRKASPF